MFDFLSHVDFDLHKIHKLKNIFEKLKPGLLIMAEILLVFTKGSVNLMPYPRGRQSHRRFCSYAVPP